MGNEAVMYNILHSDKMTISNCELITEMFTATLVDVMQGYTLGHIRVSSGHLYITAHLTLACRVK